MPFIVINGLFSSFFLVRVIKGAWMRNPQYLAVAVVGAVGAMLSLNAMEPGMADGFIAGNLAAFAGAALGWQYLRMKSRRSPVSTAAWQH